MYKIHLLTETVAIISLTAATHVFAFVLFKRGSIISYQATLSISQKCKAMSYCLNVGCTIPVKYSFCLICFSGFDKDLSQRLICGKTAFILYTTYGKATLDAYELLKDNKSTHSALHSGAKLRFLRRYTVKVRTSSEYKVKIPCEF